MAEWYFGNNGQQQGPVSEDQLRAMIAQGRVRADDLVWSEGMAQWAPAGSVPALMRQPQPAARAVAGRAVAAPLPTVMPSAPYAAAGSYPVAQPGIHPGTPVTLSYEAPALMAAPAVGPDPGPFLKLGGMFSVNGARWSGPAVASSRAIYLLKVGKQAGAWAYGGGIAGALLAHALDKPDDTRTCRVMDLPEPVRGQLDPKGKRADKDVIILPREAINLTKIGSINNTVTFHIYGEKFGVTTGLFSKGRIKRFLAQQGWAVNLEVQPTAAPMHGQGFGRAYGEAPKSTGTALRVLYAVLAIVLILLVILARAWR